MQSYSVFYEINIIIFISYLLGLLFVNYLFLSTVPRQVPDLESPEGNEVADFRRMLHALRVDVITFGVLSNRKFCVSEIDMPEMFRKRFNREVVGMNLLSYFNKNNNKHYWCQCLLMRI